MEKENKELQKKGLEAELLKEKEEGMKDKKMNRETPSSLKANVNNNKKNYQP